jgi:hypothetical protein
VKASACPINIRFFAYGRSVAPAGLRRRGKQMNREKEKSMQPITQKDASPALQTLRGTAEEGLIRRDQYRHTSFGIQAKLR